jgi:DNA-binding MarR family transcriptional regulator
MTKPLEPASNPLFVHPLIDDAGLSPGAFRVLGHLAMRVGNNGEACPSITAIAKTCRMHRRTVINAIRELGRSGFVVAEKHRGRVTIYRVFPKLTLFPPGLEVEQ